MSALFNSPPCLSVLCTAVFEGSKGGPCSLQAAALPLAPAGLSKQWVLPLLPTAYTPSASSRGSGARPSAAQAAGWPRSLLTRVLHKPTPPAGTRGDRFPPPTGVPAWPRVTLQVGRLRAGVSRACARAGPPRLGAAPGRIGRHQQHLVVKAGPSGGEGAAGTTGLRQTSLFFGETALCAG